MSYLVLARKYRPRSFDDLVGQDAVAKGLSQAIESGRIGHAFLFVGSRGTGKTSTARILARALNCAKGPTPTPCGTCDSCLAIDAGSDVDVLEIDAASNNGVDHIRELRERVGFRPMRGRFRITILDEVHMLSAGAFNALLKTLEEPPAHAKFIFATTAPEKIPDTIRSRCQAFEFRRIDEAAIVARLEHVCRKEKVKVEDGVLSAIARASRGGMRDSLSLLDQLLAYAGEKASEADLSAVLGAAGRDALHALADAVIAGDRAALLKHVGAHAAAGGEPVELLAQLADHFRACLAVALCGPDTELVEETGAAREAVQAHAESCDADRLEAIVRHLVFARERARFAGPLTRAAVESALLAASRSGEIATIGSIAKRLEALERKLASSDAPATGASAVRAPASAASAARSASPTTASAASMTASAASMTASAASMTASAASMTASASPASGSTTRSPAASGTAESFLESLKARNTFGRLVGEHLVSYVLDGGVLRLRLRAADGSARTILNDPVNRAAAERLLAQSMPGARLELEVAAADERPAVIAPSPRAGSQTTQAASPLPLAASPLPLPLPLARAAPADPGASPAAERVRDLVDGRILGRTPPPKADPSGGTR